jgi:carbonic anhydrase
LPRAGAVLAALALATTAAWSNPPPAKPARGGPAPDPSAIHVDLTADAKRPGKAGASPDAKVDAKADAKVDAKTDAKADDPPPAAVDPMEVLRQRLAGKLQRQTLRDDTTSPYDLKVVARTTPPPPAPRPAARPRAAAAGAAGTAAVAVHGAKATAGHGAAHWSYQGDGGPAAWARLRPEFNLCGTGQRQSPVDIRGGLAVDLEPVKFAYADSRFGVIDNGHTVQANIAAGSHIEVGGQRFELLQMHFHRPSEERIDGRQFEMSAHLVHRDAQGKLAVVALLIERGPAHPVVQTVWNNLPLEQHQEVPARVPLSLQALLPNDARYFTYMGSLTTPPCSEDVRWIVMRQPVTMSPEQIELFARIYPMNARPLQQLAGRRILQSQ